MNDIIKNIEAAQLKAEAPPVSGDTVKVYGKIKEETARIQVFEGIVIEAGRKRKSYLHCS